jgi:hypothetical protein
LTFGLLTPRNIKHAYGDCVQNMDATNKRLLFVGLGVIFWSIWLSQNDIIFNKRINLILYAGFVPIEQERGRHLKRKKDK